MRPTRTRDKTMKTISKIFATIMLLISSSAVFAQIELKYTVNYDDQYSSENGVQFSGSSYSEYDYNGDLPILKLSNINGFIDMDVDKQHNTLTLKILSGDFSDHETQIFQFASFDGYEIGEDFDVKITQHIFNNDDEFEFMVRYTQKNEDYTDEHRKLVLFDSKGNIIKDFGTARWISWPQGVYLINNKGFIIIEKGYAQNSAVDIYSVPTTVNPNQLKSATISNPTLSAFPNPAKTYVNISYNVSGVEDAVMTITDASGRVVEQKTVNAMSDKLRLNVANYKRGLYFYEVQGFTGRFIVE